jgi:hypothetical protein
MRDLTDTERNYPHLHKMWIILVDNYGGDPKSPMPELYRSKPSLIRADAEMARWSMGRVLNWLEGEDEEPISLELEAALDDLWEETSNV